MNITTILPVSRVQYLDRVIDSLLAQTYKPNNLLVVFDGPDTQYLEARNKIVGLEFDTVRFVMSENTTPAHSIPDRRRHIVNIHNQMREIIESTDLIFSIEDDGILPPDALHRLVTASKSREDFGMITGVELGRWGVPYVGAWTVDNINDVQVVYSVENKSAVTPFTVDEIDACGLYCALIRADLYKEHEFYTRNGLGPDVNLGLDLRRKGFKNYLDWGIQVKHLTNLYGDEVEIIPTHKSSAIKLKLLYDSTWQASR